MVWRPRRHRDRRPTQRLRSGRSLVNECRDPGGDLSADWSQPDDRHGRTGRGRRGDLVLADRAAALERAEAVLSHDTSKELHPDEIPLIRNARLLQFTAAGVDWEPTRDLPRGLPVAANKGGGAEPMSEHIVALALAAAKRLFIEHASLKRDEYLRRAVQNCRRAILGETPRNLIGADERML